MRVHRALGSVVGAIALAIPLWLGATSAAQAGARRQHIQPNTNLSTSVQPKTYSAPELDPSTAGAAAVLLGGSALLLFDRRRRRRQA